MKKLLSGLLIFVLIFTFCSCSTVQQTDEEYLIGYWEAKDRAFYICGPIYNIAFREDRTAEVTFDTPMSKFYCQDGYIYFEHENSSAVEKCPYRIDKENDFFIYNSQVK